MALLEKKAMTIWKNKHAHHVLTIMLAENCTKAVAEAQAYHEGAEGLAKRNAPVAPASSGAPSK